MLAVSNVTDVMESPHTRQFPWSPRPELRLHPEGTAPQLASRLKVERITKEMGVTFDHAYEEHDLSGYQEGSI